MMTQIGQLVSQRKIVDDAKRTQTEAELIDSHGGMMDAVKRTPATAMSESVKYTKKKRKYLKEQAELRPENVAAAAGLPTVGSIAYHSKLITAHLNRNNIVATGKGTKFGTKSSPIPYEDMLADLTKNYVKTAPNLTPNQHTTILKALKKTGMPARYIRNKKLHLQYTKLNEPVPPPPPVQQIPAGEKQEAFQTPIKRREKGKKRDYMTQGVLEACGTPL
jgi:hypothetical protein